MKIKMLVFVSGLIFMVLSISMMITPMAQANNESLESGLLLGQNNTLFMPTAQDGEPGEPVVTGELNLNATVQVFPYDTDLYGIYLVQGNQVNIVTSVPVEHVNIDRVTAKLSPDGFKIAYLVEYGSTGFNKLVVVGIDGLNANTLFESEDPGRYIDSYSWSHDSEQLAYALSRDTFAAGLDYYTAFEDPEDELDPNLATASADVPAAYTGEVWITDLAGETQSQVVDQGAMGVLGWSSDDTGIVFTRILTDTDSSNLVLSNVITTSRLITPTSEYASGVSIVNTNAITQPVITDILINNYYVTGNPVMTDFYLLEDASANQKLAIVMVDEPNQIVSSESKLWITDLADVAQLSVSPILTATGEILNVAMSPDGATLGYMTLADNDLWVSDLSGSTTQVITGSLKLAPLSWSTSGNAIGAYTQDNTVKIVNATETVASLSVSPSTELELEPLSSIDIRNYNVPFIHQLWDTHNDFGGYCACGAASTTMAVAFYGKITPHPMIVNSPSSHSTDYGWYVTEKFPGFTTSNTAPCPSGKRGYGIYGVTVRYNSTYGVHGGREYIESALNQLNLKHYRPGFPPTYKAVTDALDKGHLVILSTQFTTAGHIILVKGYTNDGKLIVNDPYGNKFAGTYGKRQIDGANEYYLWKDIPAKWSIAVDQTPPGNSNPPNITHWKGEYYNNSSLSGSSTLVRNDTNINFDWGGNSPASGIPSDNFSVRWTRTMSFDRGAYRFRTTTDDGVRLYVDNKLIINKWYDQGTTTHQSSDIFLDGGNHTVRMEYYEHGGGAVAKLSWQHVAGSGWSAQYFNNRNLSGSPQFTRNDDSVYFNWGSGGPGNGVGNDDFSVRWTKSLNVPRSGYYRFYTRADDGVRVWVDGHLRINSWKDQAPTTYGSNWLYLSKGNHSIKVEYYEHGGGAYIRFWMVPAFYTQFYNNRTLSGNPSWTGYYSGVWFNWGLGGGNNTARDDFSARWTGSAALSGGRYKFCTRTDDGVRLYIDGMRVINKWQDQGETTWCTDRDLSKGFHEIKMEYFEHGGAASAKLWWNKYSGSDALSAANMPLTDFDEEFDMMSLYGDSGYLGPLIEDDISSLTIAPGEEVFLPIITR